MNSLLSRESKLFLFTFLALSLLVSFSSAIPVTTISNSTTKGIPTSSQNTPGTPVNYSTVHVNNSQYWQGWDPQAYNTSFIQPYSRWFYNMTVGGSGDNSSFNQTLTDNIYVPYNGAIRNVNLSQRNLTGGSTNFVSFFGQNYSASNWYSLISNLGVCQDPQTFSCPDFNGDQSGCENVGCTYDSFFETCDGTINACSSTNDPTYCAQLGCSFAYTGANFTKSRIYLDSNEMLTIDSNVSATADMGITNPPYGVIRQHFGAHYSGLSPIWALAMTDSGGLTGKFTVTKAPVYASNDFFFQLFGDGVNPNVLESWNGASFILSTGSAHPIIFSINRGEDGRFDSLGNLLLGRTSTVGNAKLLSMGFVFFNNSLNVTGNTTIGANLTVHNNIYGRNICYSNGTNCQPAGGDGSYNATYEAMLGYKLNETDQRYNDTLLVTSQNGTWLSTFNSSYAALLIYGYNQTASALTHLNSSGCPDGQFAFGIHLNGTLRCGTPVGGAGVFNTTYDAMLTNKLNFTDERYNETGIINSNNASWLSTFNASYDALRPFGYNMTASALAHLNSSGCTTGNKMVGILLNGTPVCETDQTGSGGGYTGWMNQSNYTITNLTVIAPNVFTQMKMFHEFCNPQAGSLGPFQAVAISSGTIAPNSEQIDDTNHPCSATISDSNSANAGYYIALTTSNINQIRFNGSESAQMIVRLQNNTQNFTVRMGFHDSPTSFVQPTDGCYFEVWNLENFSAKCRSNNAHSEVNFSVRANNLTWYKLNIQINASATGATFTIFNSTNGNIDYLGSVNITSNIPRGFGRETGFGIIGIQNTTSAALPLAYIDYMELNLNRSIRR